MDINEIAIPFISVLHNEINLFFSYHTTCDSECGF